METSNRPALHWSGPRRAENLTRTPSASEQRRFESCRDSLPSAHHPPREKMAMKNCKCIGSRRPCVHYANVSVVYMALRILCIVEKFSTADTSKFGGSGAHGNHIRETVLLSLQAPNINAASRCPWQVPAVGQKKGPRKNLRSSSVVVSRKRQYDFSLARCLWATASTCSRRSNSLEREEKE